MRVFRFMSGELAAEQLQTISCSLHLEPIDNITEDQAPNCTCYTEEECQEPVFGEWTGWSECSVTCDGGERTRTRECTAGCTNIDDNGSNHRLTETMACGESACKYRINFLLKLGNFSPWCIQFCYINVI